MTTREFLEQVKANENEAKEVRIFAVNALRKLDEKNAKRSAKPSKTAIENEPIKKAILEYLTDKMSRPASEIGEVLNISTNKASSLCVQLVKEGRLISEDIKIPKKGKCKGYSLVKVQTKEDEDE